MESACFTLRHVGKGAESITGLVLLRRLRAIYYPRGRLLGKADVLKEVGYFSPLGSYAKGPAWF